MSLLLALTAAGDPSGSLSAQESGADVAAASGYAIAAGALAVSEAAIFDTFGSTAGALAQGQLAASETGADTTAMAAAVLAQGAMAAAEGSQDAMAASGVAPTTGLLEATEAGNDTFSGSTPSDAPVNYYGSGKAQGEADLLQKVLDKYWYIEKSHEGVEKPARAPIETAKPTKEEVAKTVAETRRQKIIEATRAKNKAKADELAAAAAKAAIERAKRPPIAMPFAAAKAAAAKQKQEDDSIMALVAMLLLED